MSRPQGVRVVHVVALQQKVIGLLVLAPVSLYEFFMFSCVCTGTPKTVQIHEGVTVKTHHRYEWNSE